MILRNKICVVFLSLSFFVGAFSLFLFLQKNEEDSDIDGNERTTRYEESEDIDELRGDVSVGNNKDSAKVEEGLEIDGLIDDSAVDSFFEDFSLPMVLEESGDMNRGSSLHWWVNSGAFLFISDGVGKTVFGELEKGSVWQKKYKDYNSSETDGGYHPQNIFRLITRSKWKNLQQECYYKIDRYILSKAKERSESNGLLLFNRYQDGDNLYYTGIRVDGFAVIKKKIKGQYFTMAYERVFPGKYDRKKKPNLLPLHQWIGLRSEVSDTENGSVNIKVFMDRNRDGNWKLVAEATDNGKNFGGKVIAEAGHAGIRTDFMDVEFDDYRIEKME